VFPCRACPTFGILGEFLYLSVMYISMKRENLYYLLPL